MRVNHWTAGTGVAAALLLASPADATLYNIDFSGAVTVNGTITTDGATGLLGTSDVTAFNFTVSGAGESVDFNSAAGYVLDGARGVTATSSGLFFDFSGANFNSFAFFSPGGFLPSFCIQDSSSGCDGPSPAGLVFGTPAGFPNTPMTGFNTQIATAAAAPESSTWAMMIIGFASLGFAAYRAKRNRLAAAFA